jgi:hypothetical protein
MLTFFIVTCFAAFANVVMALITRNWFAAAGWLVALCMFLSRVFEMLEKISF